MKFDNFAMFSRIFVVGPQRSGTRIAAKMIAHDTGHEFIDERDFEIDSLTRLYELLMRKQEKIVVQAPGITRWIQDIVTEDDLAVFCNRSLQEIFASQKRVNWHYDWVESIKYGQPANSAAIKKRWWPERQAPMIPHRIEVRYPQDLLDHPLWVDPEARKSWTAIQTEKR